MAWKLAGAYMENCNCHVLCPCITSSMTEAGDGENGRCQVPLVGHIRDGFLDTLRLDGLTFVLVVDSPAVMSQGGWRVALYIDEQASPAQRTALQTILTGHAGGPPGALSGAIGEFLGTKYVPIVFTSQGHSRHVEIPGILDVTIDGLTAPGSDKVIEIGNVAHPFGSVLPVAKARKGRYNDPDFGLAWDNTGRNGHFRDFLWQA